MYYLHKSILLLLKKHFGFAKNNKNAIQQNVHLPEATLKSLNVGKIINHAPVITIFIGGINHSHMVGLWHGSTHIITIQQAKKTSINHHLTILLTIPLGYVM